MDQKTLCIYTDARSDKVGELTKSPRAVFAFWSARLLEMDWLDLGHGGHRRAGIPRGFVHARG